MTLETVSTNSTTTASVDPVSDIANLLSEEEETTEVETTNAVEEQTETEDLDDAEKLSEESTEEVEESDEEDTTWGSVLGVDEDKLQIDEDGNLTGINVKVNGESSTVNMEELITRYQKDKSVTARSQVLAEERKTFDQQREQLATEYKSKLENTELLTNYLGNQLVQEFEGINWEELRANNPAEYAAAKQDYSAKAQELKQAQEAIQQEKMQLSEAQKAEFNNKRTAHLKTQFDAVIANNPTWEDATVRQSALSDFASFASDQYGYTANEFESINDARLYEVLKDAKAFRDGVKSAIPKINKKVPKFQKSNGKARKRVSKLDKLTKRAKATTGHNKRFAQTDAIVELLTGG